MKSFNRGIDAMGCQTAIAEEIIDKGGDYVLALKGNQDHLSDEVENYFKKAECGIAIRRQIAGWDDVYLLKVLGVKSFS